MPEGLDAKVVEVYRGVGKLLTRYSTGKIPKAFKIIPNLKNWEEVLYLTDPEMWSPHAMLVVGGGGFGMRLWWVVWAGWLLGQEVLFLAAPRLAGHWQDQRHYFLNILHIFRLAHFISTHGQVIHPLYCRLMHMCTPTICGWLLDVCSRSRGAYHAVANTHADLRFLRTHLADLT